MGGGGGEEAAMAPRLLGFWGLCRREADGSARRSGARSHVNRREPVLRNKFAFALLFFSLSFSHLLDLLTPLDDSRALPGGRAERRRRGVGGAEAAAAAVGSEVGSVVGRVLC